MIADRLIGGEYLDKLCLEECWRRRHKDIATTMRMVMAIGAKNLVRIKMMEFIINVVVVKERNQQILKAMAERAILREATTLAEKEKKEPFTEKILNEK